MSINNRELSSSGADAPNDPGAAGLATAAPTSVHTNKTACANGNLEVFAVGGDNAVWHNFTVDSALDWSGWSTLGGSIAGNLVAVWDPYNGSVVLVFGVGTDSALWVVEHPNNQDWLPFVSLGGAVTRDPAVTMGQSGNLFVFVRGTDNAVWFRRAQGLAPTFDAGWSTLGGALLNGPSAAEGPNNLVSVFVEGTDTAMWSITQPSQYAWQ